MDAVTTALSIIKDELSAIVDKEIRSLIENAHQEAYDILVANRKILDTLVVELLEKETLLKDEISEIFAKVKKISPRPAWTGSDSRKPSNLPPVAIPNAPAEKPKKRAARKKAE